MYNSYIYISLFFYVIIVTCRAEDLRQDLPILHNQTKLLAEFVCSEIFPEEQLAFFCQKKFLSPKRNVTRHPPQVSIKCQSERTVSFMVTPSENWQLVVMIPQEDDPEYVNYIFMEHFETFGRVFTMPHRNYTLWSTILNDDGTPSFWLKGPNVGVWTAPEPMKYDINVKMLPDRFKKESQTIEAKFTWNNNDESDYCFYIYNYCDKDIQGNSFDKNIEPDNNRTVVIGELPVGDECTFGVTGKYGTTKLQYNTLECLAIEGCAPLPEQFEDVRVDVLKSPSDHRWNVTVHWRKPHVIPNHYNATLVAAKPYHLTLPGNATEALFEEITGEGLCYLTISAYTASGTAYTSHDVYLQSIEGHTSTIGLLVVAAWVTALLIALLASILVYCKTRRVKKVKFDYLQRFRTKGLDDDLCKESVMEAFKQELSAEDRWEVKGSRLVLHEVVGEGAFGLVRRATLAPGKQSVAVKMLKNFPTAEEVRSFRAEMELMKSVGAHPHVVSLVGCCSGRRPLIIAEYCSLGDLLTFLRCSWDVMLSKRYAKYNNKGTLEYRSSVLKDTGGGQSGAVANKLYDLQGASEELTFPDLLSFCRQIAMGMEFLASNRVVHRDLAARNVLVAGDKTLKIADFGLSRDVYQENQYKQKGNGKMPVKWMALESLTHRIFTTQSDVWSFGVVMWEVMTVGGAPYPWVTPARLPGLLRTGYRMPRPTNCTTQLYEVMTSCWRARPCERPTFGQLHAQLDALLSVACADRYLALDLPVDLQPVPSIPQLPQLTHALLKGKDVWERGKSYERPNPLNHYTSPPATQPS